MASTSLTVRGKQWKLSRQRGKRRRGAGTSERTTVSDLHKLEAMDASTYIHKGAHNRTRDHAGVHTYLTQYASCIAVSRAVASGPERWIGCKTSHAGPFLAEGGTANSSDPKLPPPLLPWRRPCVWPTHSSSRASLTGRHL